MRPGAAIAEANWRPIHNPDSHKENTLLDGAPDGPPSLERGTWFLLAKSEVMQGLCNVN